MPKASTIVSTRLGAGHETALLTDLRVQVGAAADHVASARHTLHGAAGLLADLGEPHEDQAAGDSAAAEQDAPGGSREAPGAGADGGGHR